MLTSRVFTTVTEASNELLEFALLPVNWVKRPDSPADPDSGRRALLSTDYQRRVGALRMVAAIEVAPTLETFIRVAFTGAGLSPMKAADLLEEFFKVRMPLLPNTEWQVEIDGKRWIHFVRRWTGTPLHA